MKTENGASKLDLGYLAAGNKREESDCKKCPEAAITPDLPRE